MARNSCIFCSIISGKQPGTEVYRDPNFLVIMDKYPINFGHTLIIPINHYRDLFQMPVEEVGRLYSLVPKIARGVVSATKADGFNLGQNNGIAANQIVPHVHVHVVPRFIDDSPDGKWPARRVASDEELSRIAEKIKHAIGSLGSE